MTKEHIHLKKIQKRKSKGTCIPSQCRKSLLISPKMHAFPNCMTSALEQEKRAYWWPAEDRRQAHGVQLPLHITTMATLSMPPRVPAGGVQSTGSGADRQVPSTPSCSAQVCHLRKSVRTGLPGPHSSTGNKSCWVPGVVRVMNE